MKFLTLLLASLFLITAAGPSEARRGGSKTQQMHFVATTKIPGENGTPLSLCHLSTKTHIFGIGFDRSSDGYVLSDQACGGDTYIPLTGAQFAEAQEAGLVDPDLPAEPKMTTDMLMSGFFGWGILALLIAIGLYKLADSKRRKKQRMEQMGDISYFESTLLDIMCHAALCDGKVEPSEINLIQKVALDLTGREFSYGEVDKLVQACDKSPTPAQFKAFGKVLNIAESATAMRAALMVISADGELAAAEQKFIGGLAKGLGLSEEALQKIMRGE